MAVMKPSNKVTVLKPHNTKEFIDRFNDLARQSKKKLEKEREICKIFKRGK